MYAIVLTYDQQIGFAELLYKKYMNQWRDCPLTFRIAYNKEGYESEDFFSKKNNVEMIKSGKPIKETMSRLLEGIGDDEWVYWCIDDRYPMDIISQESLDKVYNFIKEDPQGVDRVKLFRWKEKLLKQKDHPDIDNMRFFQQNGNWLFGFWHHSFMRAGALRWFFINSYDKEIYGITEINRYNNKILKNADFKIKGINEGIVVPKEDIITFGEPCVSGKVTRNGLRELEKHNCPVPDRYKILRDLSKVFIDKDIPAKNKHSGGN